MADIELRAIGIVKRYGPLIANDHIDLEAARGETHAIMGENGAGKSTLMSILYGMQAPDEGRIILRGAEVRFRSALDAIALGMGMVHQAFRLFNSLSVWENVVYGREPKRLGLIDRSAAIAEVGALGRRFHLEVDPAAIVGRLSVGVRQRVEILKALYRDAKILILDEPTAVLTPQERDGLFIVIRNLTSAGRTVLFVTHKLNEVMAISDRVTVLRDGRVAAAGEPIAAMSRSRIVSAMIGREERVAEIRSRQSARGAPALEVRGLATSLGHKNVSFTLNQGEILGLYGLVGSGRTELARALIGDARILAGEIRLKGALVSIKDVSNAVRRHRVGYISEDRKNEGLILAHPVRGNIAITVWRRIASRLGFLNRRSEERVAAPLSRKLDIKTPSLEQHVGKLSGGNQQKVSIAKWLAAGVDVLIVDEPTVGIDIKTKTAIHELIAEITRAGVSVLLISSDMPEMITLADRILVMRDFALVGEIENERRYDSMSRRIMTFIHAGAETIDRSAQAEAGRG